MPSRAERFVAYPVSDRAFVQGESLRIDGRSGELLWIDMPSGSFHTGVIADGKVRTTRSVTVASQVGAVAPLRSPASGWLVAAGAKVLRVAEDGSAAVVAQPSPSGHELSLNDGVCAPDGAFWVGSQSAHRRPEGSLYRVTSAGDVHTALDQVTVSNGIAFTADGATMYYIDTLPKRQLEAFDVTGTGLSNRRVIATLDHGNPDGLALDDDGHVWVAMWGAGEVVGVVPSGEIVARVAVGTPLVTAVAVWEEYLYITTARTDGDENSGRIWAARVGACAPPTPGFAA